MAWHSRQFPHTYAHVSCPIGVGVSEASLLIMAEGVNCRTLSHFRLCWPLHGIKGSLRRAAYGRPALDPVPRQLAVGQFFVSTGGSVLVSVEDYGGD